jgi:hypothetical protein
MAVKSGPSTQQPISVEEICNEFGIRKSNVSFSQLYRGGGIVPNATTNNNIPTAGQISLSNFYGAMNRTILTFDINTPTSTYDLYANAVASPAYVTGITDIILNNNSVIGAASTTAYSLLIPSGFHSGDTVTFNNYGSIYGAGGNAGAGSTGAGGTGSTGGNAVYVNRPVIINNPGSLLAGGGGGGGGGGGLQVPGSPAKAPPSVATSGGGGGGGAGSTVGLGGAPNGSNAPGPAGGAGGAGGGGNSVAAGPGGAGGGMGAAGSPGTATPRGGAGTGGPTANYIVGNPFVTWINTGTRTGGVA